MNELLAGYPEWLIVLAKIVVLGWAVIAMLLLEYHTRG